jgi:AbrB family looped-hinge helix DNA binding protein
MRITSKGQVTIPQHIREEAGLLPNTEVEFVMVPEGVRIVRLESPRFPGRGERIVKRLQEAGARARSQGRITMTTEELMALTRGDD